MKIHAFHIRLSIISFFERFSSLSIITVIVFMVLASSRAFSQSPSDKPVPVIVMEAKTDEFVDRVEAIGTLRANESVELTANVTETVTAIRFDDGQSVKAGDILVEMNSAEERAMLEEAKLTMEEAKNQLERVKQAAKKGAASQSSLDERRHAYETARTRIAAIESQLRDRLIKAPFSGTVGLRNISVGALIEPGDIVTTLDDNSVMKLDFSVPSTFLSTLKTGIKVVAKAPAFDNRRFEGVVSSVGSRIDPSTRAVMARALIPNPEGLLKPGLLMTVDLLKNPREAVVIGEEALVPKGTENFVLVVDPSADAPVPERRKVATGSRRTGEVEILEGLASGEFVVSHGAINVREGKPVRIEAVDRGDESLSELLRNKGAEEIAEITESS